MKTAVNVKRIKLILFHSLGLSVLAGSLVWALITYINIFSFNLVTYVEPNKMVLSLEMLLTVYGILYLSYLYSEIPKLLKTQKEEVNKVWTQEHLKIRLSLWQRIALKINGYVFLRKEKREGWTDYLPIYLVKCPDCKQYFLDYPHGYRQYFVHVDCKKERTGVGTC